MIERTCLTCGESVSRHVGFNCPDPEEVRADIRMAAVQARLNARGILDLKFCKDTDKWNALTREQRIHELCDVLEQWLDGKCVPMKPVGDSVRLPHSADGHGTKTS